MQSGNEGRSAVASAEAERSNADHHGHDHIDMQWKMYLRFGAMILTSMVLMYWVMFVGSWELSHVRFS